MFYPHEAEETILEDVLMENLNDSVCRMELLVKKWHSAATATELGFP